MRRTTLVRDQISRRQGASTARRLGPSSPVTEPAATSQPSPGRTGTPPRTTRSPSTRIAGSVIALPRAAGPAERARSAARQTAPPGERQRRWRHSDQIGSSSARKSSAESSTGHIPKRRPCLRESGRTPANLAPSGAGSSAAARSSRLTVLGDTRTPSFTSSPTIRGKPQPGYSCQAQHELTHATLHRGRPDLPSAASTPSAPARAASAPTSAASRSTRAVVARGGSASALRRRHDPLIAPAGVAVAGEEQQADAARRAVRHPWRTCFADARPTTATSPRTRGRRRRGASADAPKSPQRTLERPNRGFETPHAATSARRTSSTTRRRNCGAYDLGINIPLPGSTKSHRTTPESRDQIKVARKSILAGSIRLDPRVVRGCRGRLRGVEGNVCKGCDHRRVLGCSGDPRGGPGA